MRRGPKPAKSTEAKPPVARKAVKDDSARVRDLEKQLAEALGQLQSRDRELAEALDQQAATSEILRVISSSPTDLQPVLDAVAENATRVCSASDAVIRLLDRGALQIAAHCGPIPVGQSLSVTRGSLAGRAVMDRQAIHVEDMSEAPEDEFPEGRTSARRLGIGTALATPLLREGVPIGAIVIRRNEVRLFTDAQIALLQTFADQAVIAIENVRLFTELQEKNKALTQANTQVTEALERQTATSEILGVISSSPTDVQPVFDAIVRSTDLLCNGLNSAAYIYDGEFIHHVALSAPSPEAREEFARLFPQRPNLELGVGRVVLTGAITHSADVLDDPNFGEGARRFARLRGFRALLLVPMQRDGRVVGVISVGRAEPGLFTDSQVQLLQTFADQAVIAVENVRLFTELQEKNRALTQAHAQVSESLEQQTATAEILRVISSSPTSLQPVLDAVAQNAARVCEGQDATLLLVEGTLLRHVANNTGGISVTPGDVHALRRDTVMGRAVIDRRTIHVENLLVLTGEYPEGARLAAEIGHRTTLATPLLREGEAIGVLLIRRLEVRPFTDTQITLLETFADQAVIAIENVRLFKELQEKNGALTEALEQQTATSEILQTIAQAQTDVQPVFEAIVRSAAQLCHASTTAVFLTDGHVLYHPANYGSSPEVMAAIRANFPRPLDKETVSGTAILTRSVVQVPDIEGPSVTELVRQIGQGLGFRSLLSVPMLRQGEAVGAITVNRRDPGSFSDAEVALLQTFADQAVIAIENVRLFTELEAANRELAAASQHKSEFLANMSHELRTPLNAIIGFSEVLSEKMFGELNEKQEEYSKDINASGQHLLSLINDILDLSKIEAGRMELELSDFHLPTALDSALTLVRERAGRRSIALHLSADERLGQIQGDERKVRQVVLNLLSNAIKFTPEGGRIEVGAVPKDGLVEVSITDTGIGIAPEDQEAVFEEFRQVGTADKKVEGTGLGLTLCRKFVELHGGKIWVKSQVGAGSTFTFAIPVRRGE